MLGIHRNPNWKELLKCCESFLRKSAVCTLTDLNLGFVGPWDMLHMCLGYDTFIMLPKKSFGQKILNFNHGFKSAILAELKNWQNGTFEPMHEIQIFFGQKTYLQALWEYLILKTSVTFFSVYCIDFFRSIEIFIHQTLYRISCLLNLRGQTS